MCGRYSLAVADAKVVYERFMLSNRNFDFQPRYNIAPGQMNPVVVSQSPNALQPMLWGLIPHWAKDESRKFKTINARVEGIDKKATYRDPFKHHRCLVPATGFYEWDKSTKPSTPYYFRLKDEDLFAFAGLYDVWRDPQTHKELYSYTIITCPANGVVGKIHTRMPVILHKEDEAAWLNLDIVEPEHLYPLLSPFEESAMEDYRVSHEVNTMRNDNGELIKPVDSK
jgi:putative SOS response-associated peptidase YedK